MKTLTQFFIDAAVKQGAPANLAERIANAKVEDFAKMIWAECYSVRHGGSGRLLS